MSADKFGLFFRAPKRTDQLPRTPLANIYVKSYLNTEYNAKDLPLITPDCKRSEHLTSGSILLSGTWRRSGWKLGGNLPHTIRGDANQIRALPAPGPS